MRHTETGRGYLPFRVNGIRVGLKAHHHARAVPTQTPHRFGHGFLCLSRKTVKPLGPFLIHPTATFHPPLGNIVPLDFVLSKSAKGIENK
jgi:hypothetical protein